MRKLYFTIVLILIAHILFAQKADKDTKKTWFGSNVLISQSMETSEQKEEPAQFQITLPKKDSGSWLVNVGVSVRLKSKSSTWLGKLTAEYHKNTLTDKKQNNVMGGYSFSGLLTKRPNIEWYVTGDAKYVYDNLETKHSLAANGLITFMSENGPFNKFLFSKKGRYGFFLSLFGGIQAQDIFKAKSDSSKGLILRPLYTCTMYYNFSLDKDEITPQPTFRISVNYTGRTDLINASKFDEGYTQLFSAGADWFLIYKPVRVSLGASFNYGSDPLKGLKEQQYWLLSVNFSKK